MCRIQNVTRKQGIYYFRRLIRLGPDKPFWLRFSLKTTSRKRAPAQNVDTQAVGCRIGNGRCNAHGSALDKLLQRGAMHQHAAIGRKETSL